MSNTDIKTPRHGHEPIKMRRVARTHEMEQAGDYAFAPYTDGAPSHMWLAVPAPDEWEDRQWISSRLPVTGSGWGWNGDKDAPTLTPSVHTVGVWHGWVRDGFLVEA